MSDIKRYDTTPRRSRSIAFNKVLYIGGQWDSDLSPTIEEQTVAVLAKVDELLAEAGTDKSRLLTAQIFLAHLERDFDAMNIIWDAWTAPGASPTRATVQAAMGQPKVPAGQASMAQRTVLIEMVVTAALT